MRAIVLDFDGTFTRVDEEAVPFVKAFRAGLAGIVGRPIEAAFDAAVDRVQSDPDRHGWTFEGHIVAPSHADPYILATTVGQILLEDRPDARQVLDALFRECYPLAATVFRPDARRVVEALLDTGLPTYVITNSATAHVEAKIRTLAPRGMERLRVFGDARKYALVEPARADARFEALPAERDVRGLHRPVLLRRGAYFDALVRVWEEAESSPAECLVCGDIYELDLAMPAALGARVHLVARPGTPEHERGAVVDAGGTLSAELSGVLELLAG